MPAVRQDAQHLIFLDIAVERQKRGRAVVHDHMRFSGQLGDPVDQPVKFTRINIAVLQDVQADNLKFLKAFEGGFTGSVSKATTSLPR